MQPTVNLTASAAAQAVETLTPGIYRASLSGYVVTLLNGTELTVVPEDGIRGEAAVTVHVTPKRVVVRFR